MVAGATFATPSDRLEEVAALVPRAERVHDLEHDPPVGRVPPGAEGAGDVDRSDPQVVAERRAEAARLLQQMHERLVDRTAPRDDTLDQVDLEDVPPQVRVGARRRRLQVADREHVPRIALGPVVLHAVDREAVDPVGPLVEDEHLRLLGVVPVLVQGVDQPSFVELDHAGPRTPRRVVDGQDVLERGIAFEQAGRPGGRVPADERRARALEVDRVAERPEPVPVPAVDAALGRVQHVDELTALVRVVEQPRASIAC